MLLLHIFGAVIAAVGLILFIYITLKPPEHEDESTLNVWKVNLSGPAPLVLIVGGILVFVFPFTSFYKNPEDPNPPTVTTLSQSATTLNDTVPTTLVPVVGLPLAPDSYEVAFDDECQEDAIFWTQPEIENVNGWWLSFESYDIDTEEVFSTFEIDTGVDPLLFGNVTAICELDFVTDVALNYWIWIYSYNDAGFSEPLFLEYLDE